MSSRRARFDPRIKEEIKEKSKEIQNGERGQTLRGVVVVGRCRLRRRRPGRAVLLRRRAARRLAVAVP